MNEQTKTDPENYRDSLRTRAANWIRQVTKPTVLRQLLHEFVNTYIYTRYSLNTGIVQYVCNSAIGRVDSAVSTVFSREPDAEELVANLSSYEPENPNLAVAEPQEMQVA